jgi:dienelactone hydrolase
MKGYSIKKTKLLVLWESRPLNFWPLKPSNLPNKHIMIRLTLLVLFLAITGSITAQYDDPIFPKPTSGYGADGTHEVQEINIPNPNYAGKNIEIYHPADQTAALPTIFYSHGYGGSNSFHIAGMLQFVAQKGYVIVYVPYQTTGVSILDRYHNLQEGFRLAARTYPDIIDTTKVGFMGHSFGGGATIGVANSCFTENNWGSNGRFMYALAPWYNYDITQAELQSFPANTKLLMEVFDDDLANDHRMAADIFNTISIPNSEKDYILVKSDTIQGYTYEADHGVPSTYNTFNVLDYYAYFRFIDALCDYTFNGNPAGKAVALGNGGTEQVTMPTGLKNLFQTDTPVAAYPESKYEFQCTAILNPRKDYCGTAVGTSESTTHPYQLTLEPNPTNATVTVQLPEGLKATQIRVFHTSGQQVLSQPVTGGTAVTLDLSALSPGIYVIVAGRYRARVTKIKG